ncbi:MAG: Fic family protein [Patescibacteria group bacterium]|nr:Fic family protein [Patescibacteria group bacterium]
MLYRIKKPDLSKIDKEKVIENIIGQGKNSVSVLPSIQKTFQGEYLYWDKIKHKTLPRNISKEEFWLMIKMFRRAQSIKSPIKDKSGDYFVWIKLSELEEFFHEIDLNTGGSLFISKKDVDIKNKQKFISRGIMEEAIASSQLEGANTTRKVARQFLREGRRPRNESEQMILNSYKTMQLIESEYKNQEMGLDVILELHSIITRDIISIPEKERGALRDDKDKIVVSDNYEIYHEALKMSFVKTELERFVKFANDELSGPFIHPIIKAVMLHFWIGYLHPFTDGNGRLARAMFYWYLLKKDYWAFAYLPISKVIKESPIQYRNAYVYSEQDDLDLTYFIDYNIRKIKLAISNFEEYLERKKVENSKMNKLAKSECDLNERQIQLLQYFYGDKNEKTSLSIHMNIYQVAKMTAIKDLKSLEKLGFLVSKKQGRNIYYYATDKIEGLFK